MTNILNNIQIEKDYSNKTTLEHRKEFAQFFTPQKIASIMADWLLGAPNLNKVLEPAFGLGIFSRNLLSKKSKLEITGYEIDRKIKSVSEGIFTDNKDVKINLEDYITSDWKQKYDGIICNPPYFKFHDYDNKKVLSEIEANLNIKLNGFTNLYATFLIKSIHQLNKNGRLAYIVPSEFLNSDYGQLVKTELIKSKLLRNVVIFNFKENVFDDALTTACILLCANDKFSKKIQFTNITNIEELKDVEDFIFSYPINRQESLNYEVTEMDPNVKWRKYYQEQNGLRFNNLIPFSNVAKVVRGIATGANDYFTFSKSKANEYKISNLNLIPCICKAIDVKSNFFTQEDFKSLEESDKKVFLFNGSAHSDKAVSKYISLGEELEIHKKYLTSCRSPWYSIENRPPAPIWVSVFNRSGLKFIRNEANISNLTTFHCVYLKTNKNASQIDPDLLFAYLLTDIAREILEDNSREYGNGLQKFEPNDLNKAMILDLSILDVSNQNKILEYYHKYRKSVREEKSDEVIIANINQILKDCFHL